VKSITIVRALTGFFKVTSVFEARLLYFEPWLRHPLYRKTNFARRLPHAVAGETRIHSTRSKINCPAYKPQTHMAFSATWINRTHAAENWPALLLRILHALAWWCIEQNVPTYWASCPAFLKIVPDADLIGNAARAIPQYDEHLRAGLYIGQYLPTYALCPF
jgi:hypothetical protein